MKSTGMNFAPGVRFVGFGGFSAALLMFSAFAWRDDGVETVTATAGRPAVLPCECPPDQPPYLVWQKAVGEQQLLVNYYKDDEDEEQTAAEYHNRTELKLTEDSCSLVFHSVRPSDQGTYTCYYRKTPLRHQRFFLEVKEQEPPSAVHQGAAVTSSVCVFVLILIAAAAVYEGITLKNRQHMDSLQHR